MSKWRNFSETSFSFEIRVRNDVAGHQPNLPQLITLTCSSFITMVFDCCFCCRSSQQIHYLRLMQQVKHPLLTSLASFPICRFLHLCPMLSAMGSFWKRQPLTVCFEKKYVCEWWNKSILTSWISSILFLFKDKDTLKRKWMIL